MSARGRNLTIPCLDPMKPAHPPADPATQKWFFHRRHRWSLSASTVPCIARFPAVAHCTETIQRERNYMEQAVTALGKDSTFDSTSTNSLSHEFQARRRKHVGFRKNAAQFGLCHPCPRRHRLC